jgi:hypothetical protein
MPIEAMDGDDAKGKTCDDPLLRCDQMTYSTVGESPPDASTFTPKLDPSGGMILLEGERTVDMFTVTVIARALVTYRKPQQHVVSQYYSSDILKRRKQPSSRA